MTTTSPTLGPRATALFWALWCDEIADVAIMLATHTAQVQLCERLMCSFRATAEELLL